MTVVMSDSRVLESGLPPAGAGRIGAGSGWLLGGARRAKVNWRAPAGDPGCARQADMATVPDAAGCAAPPLRCCGCIAVGSASPSCKRRGAGARLLGSRRQKRHGPPWHVARSARDPQLQGAAEAPVKAARGCGAARPLAARRAAPTHSLLRVPRGSAARAFCRCRGSPPPPRPRAGPRAARGGAHWRPPAAAAAGNRAGFASDTHRPGAWGRRRRCRSCGA
jgi:hypothetical protein